MYEIESEQWTGLAKVGEEAAEVLQVVNKIIGNSGGRFYFDKTDLHAKLIEEMGDLYAALDFLFNNCKEVNFSPLAARYLLKRKTFQAWHDDATRPID